jgi:hypothetical protein
MHRRVSAPQHVSVFLNGSGTAVPFNINDGLAGQRFGIARVRGDRGHLLQRRVAAGALFGEIDLGDGDQDLGAGLQIRLCVPKTLYGALVVKSDFHSFPCLTSSPILLFGPRRSHSSAPPARSERHRAQRAVKDGPVFGATASAARSVLDGCEHDGRMRRPGATRFASLVRLTSPVDRDIAERPRP